VFAKSFEVGRSLCFIIAFFNKGDRDLSPSPTRRSRPSDRNHQTAPPQKRILYQTIRSALGSPCMMKACWPSTKKRAICTWDVQVCASFSTAVTKGLLEPFQATAEAELASALERRRPTRTAYVETTTVVNLDRRPTWTRVRGKATPKSLLKRHARPA